MSRPYGAGGLIGLGAPQANPTVEAEFPILLPRTVATVTTRLTSSDPDAMGRLRAYLETLHDALDRFDTLRPDAFGFACTGSAYLLGAAEEARIVAAAEARFGYPIVTATRAIRWALDRLGARKLALITPYPAALTEAAVRYWRDAGFLVEAVMRIAAGGADTRGIYVLTGREAAPAVREARGLAVDAVLLSGTGMPTLATLAEAEGASPPVLSSNLVLAAALLERVGRAPVPAGGVEPPGWRARLAEAVPAP